MATPEQQALFDRWDGFLEKVKARFNEVLEQSKEPIKDVIEGLEYDSIIIHNILQGIRSQSELQLIKKMDESWEKMESELENVNTPYDQISIIREKHYALGYWMRDEFKRFSFRTFGDAARQIQKNIMAVVDVDKIHNCVTCGGQLKVEVFAFQAVNVKCESCGAINTYEPDGRVRALEGVFSSLAEENAMEEYIKRDNNIKYAAEYFKKYYGFIIEHLPQRKEYYERILNDKLNNPDFVGK